MRQLCELILTVPPNSDLDGLIMQLIERRLCAAGHTDHISTTYRWQQRTVQNATEVKIVLHTCTDRAPELENFITQWHPYEVPCIAYRALDASEAYGQWVQDCTS